MIKMDCYKFFSLYIKSEWNNLLSKKQRKTLNRAKDYYNNNKKVSRENAKDKYRDLSDEEKKCKERLWKK